MQSSLHDIVDACQTPVPILNNFHYFRGSRRTRRTNGGARQDRRRSGGGRGGCSRSEGEAEFCNSKDGKKKGHQEKVNCVDPQETSGAQLSWFKLVLLLFKYD